MFRPLNEYRRFQRNTKSAITDATFDTVDAHKREQ